MKTPLSCLIIWKKKKVMGSALATQLRSPQEGSCVGWVARRMMAMGKGDDSTDAVSLISAPENSVIVELGPGAGYSLRQILASLKPSRVYTIEISDAFRNDLTSDKNDVKSSNNHLHHIIQNSIFAAMRLPQLMNCLFFHLRLVNSILINDNVIYFSKTWLKSKFLKYHSSCNCEVRPIQY